MTQAQQIARMKAAISNTPHMRELAAQEAEEERVAENLYGMTVQQAIEVLERNGEQGRGHAKAIEMAFYWLAKEAMEQRRAPKAYQDQELLGVAYR